MRRPAVTVDALWGVVLREKDQMSANCARTNSLNSVTIFPGGVEDTNIDKHTCPHNSAIIEYCALLVVLIATIDVASSRLFAAQGPSSRAIAPQRNRAADVSAVLETSLGSVAFQWHNDYVKDHLIKVTHNASVVAELAASEFQLLDDRIRSIDTSTLAMHKAPRQLPWFASKRVIMPILRRKDFASFAATLDTHFAAALGSADAFAENVTFATNSADKIVYQLSNFEPMHYRFASPQWNGISLASQKRLGVQPPKAFMIGISSVNRQTNYLVSTLLSFLGALDEDEKRLIRIVIFNGNYPPAQHEDIAAVRYQFAPEMASGLLEIVELKAAHAQLRNPAALARRWGDDLARVQWRSKQVLDVAYLMDYCYRHAAGYRYFLMMEDDIIASKHFVRRLRQWTDANLLKSTTWTMASFYNPWPVADMELLPPNKFFGVIGQLFRVHDLPVIVEFLRKNFDQSPLDWLFVDFLKKFNGSIVVHTPSLFQHQGTVSSLEGKSQEGRSVDFVMEE